MSKKSYLLVIALLLAVMALAACGGSGASSGSGDSAATTEAGAAPDVPASDATATSEAQGEAASAANDASGAGDASGANATGEASTATDVGSGSDGVAGSGGSNAASGATSPESDTGAPAAGDDTGNAASGTGGTADASGNTTDSGGSAGGEGGAAGAAAYIPVSDAECTEVQGQLTQALGLEVQRGTGVASFSDLSGGTGESCQLTVTGTGADFASVPEAAMQIRQVLSDNGWTVDEQYAADSPTATIGGLRRDNQLAAYTVAWSPASGVTCPADQPISACAETLTPEQMNYTITIDLAQQ